MSAPTYSYEECMTLLPAGYQLHILRSGRYRLHSKGRIVGIDGREYGRVAARVWNRLLDSGRLRLIEQGRWAWDYAKDGDGTD